MSYVEVDWMKQVSSSINLVLEQAELSTTKYMGSS